MTCNDQCNAEVFKLLSHGPYSLNMPHWTSIVFNMKKIHAAEKYSSDFDIAVKITYFEELEKSTYRDDIETLQFWWIKCTEQGEDYVET